MLEVPALYRKFLRGERLTYQERVEIVSYDKRLTSWKKMDMRLDAMYLVEKFDNKNLKEKISLLEKTRGDTSMIDDFILKEYYQMSKNEKNTRINFNNLENKGEKIC